MKYVDNAEFQNPVRNSRLFKDGFINDITPLDAYNLNLILEAISQGDTTDVALDEKINQKATQLGDRITSIDTILSKIEDKDVIKELPKFDIKWTYRQDGDTKTYEPSASIIWFEVGQEVTLGYNVSFTDGEYEYPNTEGSTAAGCNPNGYSIKFNGNDLGAATSQFATVPVDTGFNMTATASASHTEGKTPLSNYGNEIPDSKITARTVELSPLTLKGYRSGCFYGTLTEKIDLSKLDSDIIRGLKTRMASAYTKGSLTLAVDASSSKQVGTVLIACPESETGPISAVNTTVNAPIYDLYGDATTTVDVEGYNGYESIKYKVWAYQPNIPFEKPASITFRLG